MNVSIVYLCLTDMWCEGTVQPTKHGEHVITRTLTCGHKFTDSNTQHSHSTWCEGKAQLFRTEFRIAFITKNFFGGNNLQRGGGSWSTEKEPPKTTHVNRYHILKMTIRLPTGTRTRISSTDGKRLTSWATRRPNIAILKA